MTLAGATAGAATAPHWTAAARAPLREAKYEQINLSCLADGFCLAVTTNGQTATWDGSWRREPSIRTSAGGVSSLSCVEASFCVAVTAHATNAGTVNYAVIWTGAGWEAPVELYAVTGEAGLYSSLHSVSCTGTTFCMTSGGGESFEFNGTTWTGHRGVISGTDGNGVISCASREFCVNIHDQSANTWDGSAWRYVTTAPASDQIPGDGGFVYSLACVSTTFCAGDGSLHGIVMWNGTYWRTAGALAKTAADSVSCTSVRFCIATSTTAHTTLGWDGSKWTAVAPFPLGSGATVACSGPQRCLAIANGGATAVLSS